MDTRNSEAACRNARFNEDGSITCEVFMADRSDDSHRGICTLYCQQLQTQNSG